MSSKEKRVYDSAKARQRKIKENLGFGLNWAMAGEPDAAYDFGKLAADQLRDLGTYMAKIEEEASA